MIARGRESDDQQLLDGDVIIDLGPMNPDPAADEPPRCPLGISRIQQSRKPRQRDGNFAPIDERDLQCVGSEGDVGGSIWQWGTVQNFEPLRP